MPNPIEDYALIGNQETVALVGRDGSIDWMGMPRFDSPACFAALLGAPENGRWHIAPAAAPTNITRRYLPGTMILETTWGTPTGWAVVRDVLLMGPWRHESGRSPCTSGRQPTTAPSTSCSARSGA